MVQGLLQDIAHFMHGGGVFMWIIFFCWAIGIAICMERFLKLLIYDIDAPTLMNELQRYILTGDIQGAIKVCSGSRALLPKVLKNALKRSKHPTEQIQNAIDATALEVIPKLEQRLNYLSLIANISTLLGLLGTIYGLIQSFSAVANVDPAQKSELLSKGIALAMNTTALGLISAISIMILHSFLSSKSEKIINGIDEYSVKMLDLLGTKKEL